MGKVARLGARLCGAAAIAAGAHLVLACAAPVRSVPAPTGPAPSAEVAPVAASPAVVEAHAQLLRLEDRREFDPALLHRLSQDSAASIRARTALSLGRLRRPEGGPILVRLLADDDTATAATAAFALGQLADSIHAPQLAAVLAAAADAAPTVASEAAHALGKVGGQLARDALELILRRGDPRAGAAAGAESPAIQAALLAIWKLPPLEDLEPITRWLEALDPEIRWRAAYALARRPDHRTVEQLRTALDDPDARVRAQSVRGLTAAGVDSAGLALPAVLQQIMPLLEDPAYEVAVNAARVLGGYSEPDAVRALAAAAVSARRHVALAATESLGRIGAAATEAAPTLANIAAADSLPLALRATALESLARIDSESGDLLATRFAVSPAWRLRSASARARAELDGPSSEALRRLIGDADPRVSAAALQAAIDAAADDLPSIRPLLVEQLGASDVIVRSTALAALADIAVPELLPTLMDAYGRARADTLNDAALAALDAIGATATERLSPTRAFLARFDRPLDPLVRLRAVQRLDSAAIVAAWGEPLPIDTGRSLDEYRAVIHRFVVPAIAGSAGSQAVLVTRGDSIRLRLFPAVAPLTVESFLRLADEGYFDGQEWPRVVPNFVVQGGDPRGDTSGGPGYSIRDEISRHRYGVGTLGMALAGPDTGGSQFFLTHSPQPHLDGTYAVFGEVLAGQGATELIVPGDVIQSIRSVR